jgi:serine/threonine-protein kinase
MTIQDTMFKLRGKKDVAQDIVIVGIDDASLKVLGAWPWNRDKVGRLVTSISAQRPKTIMLDMTFGPDQYQKAAGYTESLAIAIGKARNVVLGYHYSQNDIPAAGTFLPAGVERSSYKTFDDQSGFSKYPPVIASRIYPPDALLADSADGMGFVNASLDRDHHVRQQPLIVGFRGEFFPSVQIAAVERYLGTDPRLVRIQVGKSIALGSKVIPIDRHGQMTINFNGPERSFKYYSAADILNKMTAPNELSGKLVLVGYVAFGATEIYSTPSCTNLPGVELNANVIENILHGNALQGVGGQYNINLLILIAIGLFSALVLPKVSLLSRIAVLVLFLVVLVNINYILFSSFNLITRTFYPALEIVFFLAAAPIIKTGKESKADEEDEEEEEVDYEALLSSSQAIPTGSWSTQSSQVSLGQTSATPIPGSDRTVRASTHSGPKRGAAPTMLVTPEVPPTDHFGRYKVLQPIGKGAMGTVYKGLDPAIDRLVALKTIRLDQMAESDETEELRQRLTREAKAAGKLSHPNIVTIYDVGEEGPLQYIAMEFLQGQTLETMLKTGLDWDYRTLSRVMIQACEALDYAHENGIVHRDIKPANIMILEGNRVKVMDFGIARIDKSASMTQSGTALGTPNYISPEQLRGQPVDRRSDIFSLGVVFYELLTKEKPFKGDSISALIYSILHTNPTPPSEINLDIPRIFDKIIAKALVKDPDVRFQRAKDMADILRKLI